MPWFNFSRKSRKLKPISWSVSLDLPPVRKTLTKSIRKNKVSRPWRHTVDEPVKDIDLFKSELPEVSQHEIEQLNTSCKHLDALIKYFNTNKKAFQSLNKEKYEHTQSIMDVAIHHCRWKRFLKEYLQGKSYIDKQLLLPALADVFHKIPGTIQELEEHKMYYTSFLNQGSRLDSK